MAEKGGETVITLRRPPAGEAPAPDLIAACLRRRRALAPEYERLRAYYEGRNPTILSRAEDEGHGSTRLPHPFARYIALTSAGYLTGRPITYEAPGQEAALRRLTDCFHENAMDSVDAEIALQASIYGKGVERVYTDRQGQTRSVAVSPEDALVVYDDTVAHDPLFGLCLTRLTTPDGAPDGSLLEVLTDRERLVYRLKGEDTLTEAAPIRREKHYFGQPPLIEYWNNSDETGDFATVLPLIDGYDLLQSERLHDKEAFADSLLVLTGCQLEQGWHTRVTTGPDGSPVTERVPDEDPARRLRRERCLSLPDSDASAQYLTHSLHEADTEVLRAALREDIHKFCFVPDLSDRQFAQNLSGVAMQYKLMGLEQWASVKERWFREGLRLRLALYARMLALGGGPALDPKGITCKFSRAITADAVVGGTCVHLH